jgi:hypothetical protein
VSLLNLEATTRWDVIQHRAQRARKVGLLLLLIALAGGVTGVFVPALYTTPLKVAYWALLFAWWVLRSYVWHLEGVLRGYFEMLHMVADDMAAIRRSQEDEER